VVFLSPSRTSAGIMAKMRPRKLSLLVLSSALFSDQPAIRRYEAVILTAYRMPKKIFTQELEGTRRHEKKTQEKMERGSIKRSSSAGSEKMERVGGR